jgi:hypothetical protein
VISVFFFRLTVVSHAGKSGPGCPIETKKEWTMQDLLAFFGPNWGPLPMGSWLCLILLVGLLVFYFGFYRKRQQ